MKNLRPLIIIIACLVILIVVALVTPKAAISDIATGLVGYWKFDDGSGTTAVDSSGSGNNGTLVNGPVWTTGQLNGALNFDGVDDYVNAGTNVPKPANLSFFAWVKRPIGVTSYSTVASWGGYSSGWRLLIRRSDNSPYLQITCGADTVPTIQDLFTAAIANDAWTFVGFTWDGSIVRNYVNGQTAGTASHTTCTSSGIKDTTSGFIIGRSSSQYYYDNAIDEVRVYNRALSSVEILELYNYTGPSTTTPKVSGWGWSDTIGWISFNSTNDGSSYNYGVDVDLTNSSTQGLMSGYAWSDNVGWIKFAPTSGFPALPSHGACVDSPNYTTEPCNNIGAYNVSGWARVVRCETNPADCVGWDGWIKLGDSTRRWPTDTTDKQVKINPNTKEFEGWAWGSDVIGWISFNCKDTNTCGN